MTKSLLLRLAWVWDMMPISGMSKPPRRLTRIAIVRARTRLGELYGAPALEPGKRWLVEKLLQEVRRG